MIPYLMAMVGTILNLARVCPKCGHRQVVSIKKKHESVRCTKCGSDIPPNRRTCGPSRR